MTVAQSSLQLDSATTVAESTGAEISRRLRSAGYAVLRLIECEYCAGVVVLRGRVSTYYMKQLAQATLFGHPAVQQIVNLIEVSDDSGSLLPSLRPPLSATSPTMSP